MVFAEIIGAIVFALAPIDVKLALADAIADPVEAHVHGLRSFLFNVVVGDASGCTVVGLDGSRGLRMTHFLERRSKRASGFAIMVQCTQFGFSCT